MSNRATNPMFKPAGVPLSPQEFRDHVEEQRELRSNWLDKKVNEVNKILVELAGNKPQTCLLNRNPIDPDYIAYVKDRVRNEGHFDVPADAIAIYLDLGSTGIVVDPDLLPEFAQRFIDVGWGSKTTAHIRACHDYDVWLFLDPVEDEDDDFDEEEEEEEEHE